MMFAASRLRPFPRWMAVLFARALVATAAAWLAGFPASRAAAEETPSSYGAPAKVDTPLLRLPLQYTRSDFGGRRTARS